MSKKWIFLIGIFLCLLAGGWAYYQYQKPRADIAAVKAAYALTAAQLYNEFAANEGAANKKYTSKVITVKGQVQDVQTMDSAVVVLLAANNEMGGVNCSFLSSHKTAVQKGQWITVKGRCTGFLMDVNLVDARLVP